MAYFVVELTVFQEAVYWDSHSGDTTDSKKATLLGFDKVENLAALMD